MLLQALPGSSRNDKFLPIFDENFPVYCSIISVMIKAKIISDSRILNGKPVIAGTRISVQLIMNFLSAGMNIKDILSEYPELKKSEVLGAIEYAAKLVSKTKSTSKEAHTHSSVILHEITR